MPFKVPSEIGDRWDVGIETRDGSTLAVLDRTGATKNISQCAFMTSTKHEQEEATELQEKSKLVQLQTNIVDREFDQWVQDTQGDWTGGALQRVRGGPQSDPTRYWDGLGILWPINDYIPSQPFQPPAYTDAVNLGSITPLVVAGYIISPPAGGPATGYAFTYQTAGAVENLTFIGENSPSRYTITSAQNILDLAIGHGYIWAVTNNAGTVNLNVYKPGAAPALVSVVGMVLNAGITSIVAAMACGNVGNQQYVSVVSRKAPTGNQTQDTIRLLNVTTTTSSPPNTSFVDLAMPTGYMVKQTGYLGDSLIISMSDGMNSLLVSYSISGGTFSTLAQLPGSQDVFFTSVAGGLFLTTVNTAVPPVGGGGGNINRSLNLFLLQGGSLQSIGPVIPQLGSGLNPSITDVLRPSAFGPYAIFAVNVTGTNGSNLVTQIYAYDVLNGRLFKMASVPIPIGLQQGQHGLPFGVYSARSLTSPVNCSTDWGIALNVCNNGGTPNIQEVNVGIQPTVAGAGAVPARLQGPVSITSPLIDFTSAQNKLYRQVLASFSPLANDANQTVTLNIWLDQDPANLASAPDFTATISGSAANAGVSQLAVNINKVARKLVYQVITAGGVYTGGAWHSAPKLISVAVRAASGWAWHLFLALTRNARMNGENANEFAYDDQPVNKIGDEVAAYNFLKQLWRLKGGQCKLTMPNGDSYNAMLQYVKSRGPKPFAASFQANIPDDRFENVIEVLVREDV